MFGAVRSADRHCLLRAVQQKYGTLTQVLARSKSSRNEYVDKSPKAGQFVWRAPSFRTTLALDENVPSGYWHCFGWWHPAPLS